MISLIISFVSLSNELIILSLLLFFLLINSSLLKSLLSHTTHSSKYSNFSSTFNATWFSSTFLISKLLPTLLIFIILYIIDLLSEKFCLIYSYLLLSYSFSSISLTGNCSIFSTNIFLSIFFPLTLLLTIFVTKNFISLLDI